MMNRGPSIVSANTFRVSLQVGCHEEALFEKSDEVS